MIAPEMRVTNLLPPPLSPSTWLEMEMGGGIRDGVAIKSCDMIDIGGEGDEAGEREICDAVVS